MNPTTMLSTVLAQSDNPSFTDNEVLNEFTIPFGAWIEQAVNWITLNMEGVLDAIAWPFEFLLGLLVDDFLLVQSWVLIVGIMFLIAWLVRNLSVAVVTALSLTMCGLLGGDYWIQTARTIGFIVVAVVVCVIIGIPVGILCGRVDSAWNVVRPVLDAMQVIHSFVYMLPFIYFWGIGRVGATMATMVFALPPLIRLTNLGIRQVPEDVVEASRAYGAPELRVLADVQLPLARPAIMTGINQTLLMAFSMLGVAAIMGASGLGLLLFRAIGQQDAALAASSGLAFFTLAVVLDRIAQPDSGSGRSLFSRISAAWKNRDTPEVLLEDPSFNPSAAAAAAVAEAEAAAANVDEGSPAPVDAAEKRNIAIAGVGAVVMLVSLVLTWANDAGPISGYSRRADLDLSGQSFNGISASGGSWFGVVVALLSILVLAAAVAKWMGPKVGPNFLSADGAAFASIAALVTAFAYFIASPPDATVDYSHGIGVYVALLGGVVASVGSLMWLMMAPHEPREPLKQGVQIAPIFMGGVAVALAVISLFSAWTFDERAESIITPEIQAQIDDIMDRARNGEIEAGVAASDIQVIRASAAAAEKIVIDGKASNGAGLGIWGLVFAVLGLAGSAVTAGMFGLDDRRQWIASAITMGLGMGLMGIAIGWTGTLARATDPNIVSGVGVLVLGIAGSLVFGAGRLVAGWFGRSLVYVTAHEVDEAHAIAEVEPVSV